MKKLPKLSSKPVISIVIPAFNEEMYLPLCLGSLTKQTFTNFEVIVVDNNCTDNTARIAKKYGARVVKEKSQGMIAARQKGFKVSQGEIVARLDADAEAMPNWLSVIKETFDAYPDVVGITGNFTSSSKRLAKGYEMWSYTLVNLLGKGVTGHAFLIGSNSAFRKSALLKISPHMDERLNEDLDLSCHLAEIGSLRYVPEMMVTLSMRRIRTNPLRGMMTYGVDYPQRYIRTIHTHYPYLKGRIKRKGGNRFLFSFLKTKKK